MMNDSDQGGAFHYHVDDNGHLNIDRTVFAGCYCSGDGGGAIHVHGIDNIIENTAFLFCVSWGVVGEDCWDEKSEEMKPCDWMIRMGGGIRFWYTDGTLQNCSFINCGSNSCGGALGHARYYDTDDDIPKGKKINLVNCILASNWASEDGGAIIMRQESYDCLNCSFLHNRAKKSGSVLAGDFHGSVLFESCIFVENWNDGECDNSKKRGAIVLWPVDNDSPVRVLKVLKCSFYKNHAENSNNCLRLLFIYLFFYLFGLIYVFF
jgi:hypothetical protein